MSLNQVLINVGQSVNDKGGDKLRDAFLKVNQAFTELYATTGADIQIPSQTGNGGKYLTTSGTTLSWATVTSGSTNELVNGANNVGLDSLGNLTFTNGEQVKTNFLGGGLELYHSSDNTIGIYDGYARINTFTTGGAKHTWEFDDTGLTAFPAISNESLFIQASELGSANASIGISAKNSIIVTANILDTAKQWIFGTEGKLTLPAGTTYEYLSAPLTGHGDGLARLDFGLVTDGVSAQWIAALADPAGSGYSPGDTFTFDEEFLGIPGASVTIEVITVGDGGSVEDLAFSTPPRYPADIYRDSPINLQVGAESNRWTFRTGGYLNLPGGTSQIISSSNNVSIEANGYLGGSNLSLGNLDVRLVSEQDINLLTAGGAGGTWTFRKDGTLALPADPGTSVLTVDDIVPTPGIYRATTSNDPVAIRDAYSTWYGVEENFKLIVEQDELIRGSNFPWHGMPSWEAYPLILNWNGGGLPPSSSMAPAAKTAMDSYFLWKELESNIDIVSGNKTFSFENTGSLLLPGELTFADTANAKIVVGKLEEATWTFGGNVNPHALTWPDGSWQSSAFQGTATTAGGLSNAGNATVAIDPLGVNKVWTFGTDAVLTLPQAGKVSIEGITAVNLANLETAYNDAEALYSAERTTWMTVNNHTPRWYLLTGPVAYNEILDGAYTEPDWTGTPTLESRALAAYTAYNTWQTAITNSKLTVKSATASWTFDSENRLTLSNGGVVAGGDAAAVQAAYTEWQSDDADWYYVITTGGADQNIRPWHFAGPSRAEKQAVLLSMWQAQQTLGMGDTLGWVPISAAYYNEVRSWLALESSFDGYNEWKKLTTSVNITSEDKTWTFTNDGELTLPGGITKALDEDLVITTSYTGMSSPPGPVTKFVTFGANGNLTLSDGVMLGNNAVSAPVDENFSIITSYYLMSSPPVPGEELTNTFAFSANGSLTLPSGAGFVKGDSGQLKTNDGTTLSLDLRDTSGRGFYTNSDGFSLRGNGSNTWKFGTDSKLTLPGSSNTAFIQDANDRMLIANYGTDYWTTLGINSVEGKFDFGIKDTDVGGTILWSFDKDSSTTFPGDLRGPQVIEEVPGGSMPVGNTLKITPASEVGVNSKSFAFRIDHTYGSFNQAYLEMPTAETNKTVGLSFAHDNGTVGYIFNQGTNPSDNGFNNAVNILANGTNIKLTAEDGGGGLSTWKFGTDGRTTFPNGVVPAHSYGAAGDKEGMVVFSDPYIYYCKQDYVDDVTDIWVRVAWTGTNW